MKHECRNCNPKKHPGFEAHVSLDLDLNIYIYNQQIIQLKSLEEEPLKLLGSKITFKNTAGDHFEILEELLTKKLSNLDKCSVRGEYKVAIYSRYA